jgi:hypothetical protein
MFLKVTFLGIRSSLNESQEKIIGSINISAHRWQIWSALPFIILALKGMTGESAKTLHGVCKLTFPLPLIVTQVVRYHP